MRKLFLTSVAAEVLDKITPLLPKEPEKLKVAFVPTGAEVYGDVSWLSEDRDKLLNMGFSVEDVSISEHNKESLKNKLKDFDIIFVSGGNTFYLLQEARKSGFDEVVKDLISSGTIYIGSSAGSVLLAPTIEYVKDFDDPKDAPDLTSYDGLGVIDFLFLPHAGNPKYEEIINRVKEEWQDKSYDVKLLTNSQALIIEDNNIRLAEA